MKIIKGAKYQPLIDIKYVLSISDPYEYEAIIVSDTYVELIAKAFRTDVPPECTFRLPIEVFMSCFKRAYEPDNED